MSDGERDERVSAVLADVSAEVADFIRPAGTAAAHAWVRRRRRNRIVAGGLVTAVLVLGAATGIALAGNRPEPGPHTAESTSPEPSPSRSVAPSPPPSSTPPPDPGIPTQDILNGSLPVPTWAAGLPGAKDCPSGTVTFRDGKAGGYGIVRILGTPAHVDVDHDGHPESVVLVQCDPQAALFQVLVYHRVAGGPIRLFGRVLATPTGPRDRVDVMHVHAVEGTADGQVRIDVGEFAPCCAIPADTPQHQWRTYGWNGQRFVQTGGPTTFGPNPKFTDLSVSAPDIVLTKQSDGTWGAQVNVRVVNNGPKAAHGTLTIFLPEELGLQVGPPDGCTATDDRRVVTCSWGTMRVGQSHTATLYVWSPAPGGSVRVTFDIWDGYPDLTPDDNSRELRVTTR